jgi:hypothetical protein
MNNSTDIIGISIDVVEFLVIRHIIIVSTFSAALSFLTADRWLLVTITELVV